MKKLALGLVVLFSLSAWADTISSNVWALSKLLGTPATQKTSSNALFPMIMEFLAERHGYETSKKYELISDAGEMYVDSGNKAGTLLENTAVTEVLDSVIFLNEEMTKEDIKKLQKQARQIMTNLIYLDAVFGFDGGAQNGCAAPEPYLMVLDTEHGKVYGFELRPCHQE